MKISVIGAGAIGSAVVHDIADQKAVTQVLVCDAMPGALKGLHDRIDSSKLRTFQINARDLNMIQTIVRGSDCVISCASPDIAPDLAAVCVDLGIHFCDLGGGPEAVQRQLAMETAARKKSIWVVPNCGLAPGLVNMLCVRAVEEFDEVTSAQVRVGDLPLNPSEPFQFQITFSPEKLIRDYTTPAVIIKEGKLTEVPSMSGLETMKFPKPFGEVEAFYTSGVLSTLPYDLEGKLQSLDCKTIRYPGHADRMRFLFALGFAEKRSIDVRTHLTYRDLLIRRMKRTLATEEADAVLLRVTTTGVHEGRRRTLIYELIDRFDEEQGLTAMKRCTAFPVAAIALLLAEDKVKGGGAAPPERIIPKDQFFRAMTKRGLNITRRWHDAAPADAATASPRA